MVLRPLYLAAVGVALLAPAPALAALPDTLLWGVAAGGRVVQFTSAHPERVQTVLLKGIRAGEEVIALDVRPADGKLYLVTSANLVYVVDTAARTATPVSTTPFEVGLESRRADMDINPASDRIRLVTDTNESLRVNPANGQTARRGGELDVDARPTYAEGDRNAGRTPRPTAVAHTANRTGASLADSRVLVIDVAQDVLGELTAPNRGVLETVGPLGLDAQDPAGFDVTPDGDAFAALQPAGASSSSLYTIDTATGAATLLGPIGGGAPVGSIAALGGAPALPPFAVRIAGVASRKIGSPVTVRLTCTQTCNAAATLRHRGSIVAVAPEVGLGTSGSLRLLWTAAGRKRLGPLRRVELTVVVSATGADGTTTAARRIIELLR